MIDLHCHILPFLDDGAQSLPESLAMARMAVDSGVVAMAATPHCIEGNAAEVRDRVLLLREVLEEEEIPLRIFLGMEIFGTENTPALLRSGSLLTLNNSRYPLIEFGFRGLGERETEILWDVIQAGYRPIVAHPERYEYIQEKPELIDLWFNMGCLLQVNRGSLMGRFGSEPRHMAMELVKRGFACAVASDGHSPRMRTPWMADVRQLLSREVSPAAAEILLLENPASILRNQLLDPVEPEWFS